MNADARGTAPRARVLLLLGLAACALVTGSLALAVSGSAEGTLGAPAAAPARAVEREHVELASAAVADGQDRTANVAVPQVEVVAEPLAPVLVPAEDAIRALAQNLADAVYERRSFEAEVRARLANVAVDELGFAPPSDADIGVVVARAALLRVACVAQSSDAARLRPEVLSALRTAITDETQPRGVLEQAASALAALGDDGDRARLFATLTDVSAPRGAAAARIGLECLAGPGAAAAIAAEIAREAELRADGPVLALATAWTSARAATLTDAERAACAATFADVAERTTLDPRARARVLTCLHALDPERAAQSARVLLADPATAPELARSACTSIRAGALDAPSVLALATDAGASAERRLEIAAAFLGSAQVRDAEAALVAQVRDVVRALRPDGDDPRLRPRDLH